MTDPASGILTAMITPAVLISGVASLLFSTSARLGRATDRVRALTERFDELVRTHADAPHEFTRAEKRLIVQQIPQLTRRTRYLHRAMTALYLSIGLLVLTSLFIGGLVLFGLGGKTILPVITALLGSIALAYGALLLSYEANISAITNRQEMQYLTQLSQHYAHLYDEK